MYKFLRIDLSVTKYCHTPYDFPTKYFVFQTVHCLLNVTELATISFIILSHLTVAYNREYLGCALQIEKGAGGVRSSREEKD